MIPPPGDSHCPHREWERHYLSGFCATERILLFRRDHVVVMGNKWLNCNTLRQMIVPVLVPRGTPDPAFSCWVSGANCQKPTPTLQDGGGGVLMAMSLIVFVISLLITYLLICCSVN
ncbi:hypothetical protein XENTR_v10024907 [Xenopus tropicalis]|nr:hypothetical protein XENTR_v10024907 [Xenopus tropicalis]